MLGRRERNHGGRSSSPRPAGGRGQAAARAGGVLAATCLSTFVVNANTSAVSILLPAISADTGMDVTTLQWAVTGYSLVGAAVIVTSGSLGDVFGRKRVFQLGLMLFVVSCIFIALSSSGGAVIAGRFIQGAAGATILACGLSLLSVANAGQAQLRAVSLWGAQPPSGPRPARSWVGCWSSVMGWQGLFWVDAVIGAVCIVITARQVSESRDTTRSRSIDYAGSLLIALTLAPLILALSKGGDWGWARWRRSAVVAIGVASGFAFVAVERRVAVPMLDLGLLRNRVLVGSTIAILIGAGTINALMYLLSLYFQDPDALGFTTLQAGLATLPATVGLVAIAAAVPRLTARLGGRQVVAIGFLLTASASPPSGSSTPTGRTAPSCCRSWPWRWAWACRTGRRHPPRRRACRRSRSGPRPGSRTWRATSGRRWPPRWPRRSTAPSSPTAPPRAARGRCPRLGPRDRVVGDGRLQLPRRAHGRRHGSSPGGARHHPRLGAAAASTAMTLRTTATGTAATGAQAPEDARRLRGFQSLVASPEPVRRRSVSAVGGRAPRPAPCPRSLRVHALVGGVDEGQRLLHAHQDELRIGVGLGEDVAQRDRAALAEAWPSAGRKPPPSRPPWPRTPVRRSRPGTGAGRLRLDRDPHAPRRGGAQVRGRACSGGSDRCPAECAGSAGPPPAAGSPRPSRPPAGSRCPGR